MTATLEDGFLDMGMNSYTYKELVELIVNSMYIPPTQKTIHTHYKSVFWQIVMRLSPVLRRWRSLIQSLLLILMSWSLLLCWSCCCYFFKATTKLLCCHKFLHVLLSMLMVQRVFYMYLQVGAWIHVVNVVSLLRLLSAGLGHRKRHFSWLHNTPFCIHVHYRWNVCYFWLTYNAHNRVLTKGCKHCDGA